MKPLRKYRAGELEVIRSNLKPKDKQILKEFLIYCGGTAGEKKLKNYERIMLQIHEVSNIPYSSWDLKKLREFLAMLNKSNKFESTKNDIKKTLKRFLREYYKDWEGRFNKLKDIKQKDGRNHKKINSHTLLTKEEIEKLVRLAENLRYKSMIMLMFESAGRPEEILKLKWSDLDLEKGRVKLHSEKTGKVRVNPIKETIIHLQRYKQEYPFPNIQASDFVYPSPRNRKQQLSNSLVDFYFKELGKKIQKHFFPYLLRHTRLNPLRQILSPEAYEQFAGHSMEVGKEFYAHLSSEEKIDEVLEKVYHIEELTQKEKDEVKKLRDQVRILLEDKEKTMHALIDINTKIEGMKNERQRKKHI